MRTRANQSNSKIEYLLQFALVNWSTQKGNSAIVRQCELAQINHTPKLNICYNNCRLRACSLYFFYAWFLAPLLGAKKLQGLFDIQTASQCTSVFEVDHHISHPKDKQVQETLYFANPFRVTIDIGVTEVPVSTNILTILTNFLDTIIPFFWKTSVMTMATPPLIKHIWICYIIYIAQNKGTEVS